MIRKMNSSDFEKVYKLVCDLEETCFDFDKMKNDHERAYSFT